MSGATISRRHPIVLVSGGTGGHVFPAQALAQELQERGFPLALMTDSRGAAWSGEVGDVATHAIRAGRVSGVGLQGRLKGAADLAMGTVQSRRILGRLAPSVVVGFGGYASVPAMLAASTLNVTTVIHDQNALLGRANRLLAPRVSAIATAFPTVERLRDEDMAKTVFTGNPVRSPIRRLRDIPYAAPRPGEPVRILVTGGSQGASVFSHLLPRAIACLPEDARRRLHLTQQCRQEDIENVRAAYRDIGFEADLATFFDDMPARLAAAHLMICRSGASTVAELTTAGRPAILIPYPHAADDHQTANARAMADAGGAELLPESGLTPEMMAAQVQRILDDTPALARMAAAARATGQRDAAGNLAILVAELAANTAPRDHRRRAA